MDKLSSMKASIASYLPELKDRSEIKADLSSAAGGIWSVASTYGIPGIAGGLATGFAYNLLTGQKSINHMHISTNQNDSFTFNEANEVCLVTGWAMHVFSNISKVAFTNSLLQRASTITGCFILAANALSSHPVIANQYKAVWEKYFPTTNKPKATNSTPYTPWVGNIRKSSARAIGIMLMASVALLYPKISKKIFTTHLIAGVFFGFGVNYLEGQSPNYQDETQQKLFHLNAMNELCIVTGLAMGLLSNTSSLVGRVLNNQSLATAFRISGYVLLVANAVCSKYKKSNEINASSEIPAVTLFKTQVLKNNQPAETTYNIRPGTARAGGIMLVGIVAQLLAASILSPQKV